MKIRWSPLSVERLTSAVSYISEEKPIAAQNLADSIIKAVERLRDFQQSGRSVPELENPKYREILVKNYRIIYTLTENAIHILTIRHQIQLLNKNNIK